MTAAPGPAPDLPRLLSLDETCSVLGVRRDLLFAEVLPHLPTVRIGRRRLVHPDDLRAYVDARRGAAGTERQ